MVIKIFFKIFLFLFFFKYSFSEVIYEKNNIIITEFDIEIYQQLYNENYNTLINDANSLKDLVLINSLIKNLKINNPEFIKKIDSEILIRFGQNSMESDTVKIFRFSRIRDEFIINYFQNKLEIKELEILFKELDSLNLPISIDNCLIIKEIIDLKDNEDFIKSFYNNLKSNKKTFK